MSNIVASRAKLPAVKKHNKIKEKLPRVIQFFTDFLIIISTIDNHEKPAIKLIFKMKMVGK